MSSHSEPAFPTTSHFLLAGIQSPAEREISLKRFCELYHLPIYGWLRRRGLAVQDAQDQTQIFFMRVLRDGFLQSFKVHYGTPFRSWLMTCLQNQLRHEHEARQTLKRGGGKEFVPYDAEKTEHDWQSTQLHQLEAGPSFDLLLAREIWRSVKEKITQEKAQAGGNVALTQALLPLVLQDKWPQPPFPTQQQLAEQHGSTHNQLSGHFHHTLKKKSRRIFQQEAETSSPGITEEEVDYLWLLLRRHGEAVD